LTGSAENLRAIIEALPLGVAVVHDGRFVFANRALGALAGYSDAAFTRLPPSDLFAGSQRQPVLARLEGGQPGERLPSRDVQLKHWNGSLIDVELSGLNVSLDAQVVQLLFVGSISDRKALQARLALVDRMASVGTLAAGVAHEINNPLAFVTMNLGFVGDELNRLQTEGRLNLAELGDLTQALREAREGCRRVRHIVRSLKTFSRADGDWRSPVEVETVVERCLRMMANEIRRRAQLVKTLEPVPTIEANEAQLGQVLINLLSNAVQALPEGDAQHHTIEVSLRADGDELILGVRDTGSGIAPEHRPRIFDPFFTTKPVGSNTGLGLSIAHSLVTSLGGRILLETAVGAGSTFSVHLPRQPRVARDGLPAVRSTPARLLVVDDEPALGAVVQRTLRSQYAVETVQHPQRVLDLVKEGVRFDLILCDLIMPEMSGVELHSQLEALAPDQAHRMVFMTAGAFTTLTEAFFREPGRWRLEKPFEKPQLERVIAQALQSFGG
jgi:PAS domain S-box-containing protein